MPTVASLIWNWAVNSHNAAPKALTAKPSHAPAAARFSDYLKRHSNARQCRNPARPLLARLCVRHSRYLQRQLGRCALLAPLFAGQSDVKRPPSNDQQDTAGWRARRGGNCPCIDSDLLDIAVGRLLKLAIRLEIHHRPAGRLVKRQIDGTLNKAAIIKAKDDRSLASQASVVGRRRGPSKDRMREHDANGRLGS